MKLIKDKIPFKVLADEGKHIRSINDIYEPERKDEEGNIIPEHFPSYSKIIYVPSSITEEIINDIYIEEDLGNV